MNPDRTCDSCGTIGVHAKGLCKKCYQKKYQEENRKSHNDRQRIYAEKNKEYYIEYCREYNREHRAGGMVCIKCGAEIGGSGQQYCNNCSSNEYCHKFNKECKTHNREKYNNECFFCGKTKEENNNKNLSVHHVDYNKQQGCGDTTEWKLIPLCNSCHSLTNGSRENRAIWEERIVYLLNEYWNLGGQNLYIPLNTTSN